MVVCCARLSALVTLTRTAVVTASLLVATGCVPSADRPMPPSARTGQSVDRSTPSAPSSSPVETTADPTAQSEAPPSNADRCHTSELALDIVGSFQAMNQPRLEFQFTNRSGRTCQLYGWPGIQMLDAQGHHLPTAADRVTGIYVSYGQERPILVHLPPGGHAYFGVGWVNEVAPPPCENPADLLVTPPDEANPLRVAASSASGTMGDVCGGGAVAVLPVQPATTFIRR